MSESPGTCSTYGTTQWITSRILATVFGGAPTDPPADNPVRDPAFYRIDGDCKIQFHDTLFKIHWHYLSPDGEKTAFTPFRELTDDVVTSGDSPLVLIDRDLRTQAGETNISGLRAFLGYAYSSPFNLRSDAIPDADLRKLNKSFLRWAMATVHDVATRNGGKALDSCPVEIYIWFLESPDLSRQLRSLVEEKWTSRLERCELPIADALEFSEVHAFRKFQMRLYDLLLYRLDDIQTRQPTKATAHILRDLGVNRDHQFRLLQGAHADSLFWSCAISRPPVLPPLHPLSAPDARCSCAKRWKQIWNDAVLSTLKERPAHSVHMRLTTLERNLALGSHNICPALEGAASGVGSDLMIEFYSSRETRFFSPTFFVAHS
ncbi:hypothetical protein B0H11DRAFT_2210739 [Mycena galericulata]|nr:hypothetical protein B0H11DRAFT_2210739 [Mycena galericulata]